MSSFRILAVVGTMLLLGAVAPAQAAIVSNALIANALIANALIANALIANALVATGSAISDLNGVAVDSVTLPATTQR